MKPKSFTKIFFAAAFLAMLWGSSSVFAQVKIGTNPTTIGANNNLEVEASTTGRKTSIDKATGQVTIQDGTQGNSKVFTSDANGGGNWQLVGPGSILALPKGLIGGGNTANLAPGTLTDVSFTGLGPNNGGITQAGNGLRVPTAGFYYITQRLVLLNSGCSGTNYISTQMNVKVNGSAVAGYDDRRSLRSNDGFTLEVTDLMLLNANDVITAEVRADYTAESGCTTKVIGGRIIAVYQP